VAKANPSVVNDPEPSAFFVNFGDNALEFKLWVWSELTDAGYSIRSELAVAVQEALEHAGIGVPFPQRDLHIKSDVPMRISKESLQPVVKDSLEDAGDKGSKTH